MAQINAGGATFQGIGALWFNASPGGAGIAPIVALATNVNGIIVRSVILVGGAAVSSLVIGNGAATHWVRALVAQANLYDEARQMPLVWPAGLQLDYNASAACTVLVNYDLK